MRNTCSGSQLLFNEVAHSLHPLLLTIDTNSKGQCQIPQKHALCQDSGTVVGCGCPSDRRRHCRSLKAIMSKPRRASTLDSQSYANKAILVISWKKRKWFLARLPMNRLQPGCAYMQQLRSKMVV